MSLNTNDNKLIKIGIFYDGGYFARVSHYYRHYDQRRSRISIKGLHEFIREKVHELEDVDKNYCQIVDAHYFRGRFSAYEAAKRSNQLFNERLFDDVLMYGNIVTHYLPMMQDRTGRREMTEKGIDVWFALEAYELAILKRFNVVVLITGDGDHLPLIRKLNTLGTRVMLLYWDIEFPADSAERSIRTSQTLINEATHEINMVSVLNNRKLTPIVEGIFLESEDTLNNTGQEEEEARPPRPSNGHVPTRPETPTPTASLSSAIPYTNTPGTAIPGKKYKGKVIHIDHQRGIGNLNGQDTDYANLIFFRNFREPEGFDELQKYDTVEFEVSRNLKGELAVNVRLIEEEYQEEETVQEENQ
ncbi:MAG: NYN domain-containing protein [Cytophagaceae bacterium]|nr:NYN domain-containing protein [Cytophagaceae bacterium]